MSKITVPLKNIVTDEENPVDLTALPEAEAIERIKQIYGFLASVVDVTIADGMATIEFSTQRQQQVNQALRTMEQASKQAKQGRYTRAIPMYQEVLSVLPDHTEARRELAMALMETGSAAAAKKQLIRVMQLDPNDAWAYLIMGNLYGQVEKDLGSAARYFESALDLAPNDPYILTSYGGVEGMRGDYDRARALLTKALEQAPHSPNAQHGLALIHQQLGELDEALALLEGLFASPESEDPRHQLVYQQARSLYRNIRRRRAEQNHEQLMAQMRQVLAAYSKASGYQVRLQEDRSLETTAKIELAWRYGRAAHVIRYNTDKNAVGLPYLIAHEFEHALLAQEARAAQRNLHFATDQNTERVVYAILDKDIRNLHKRRDLSPQMIDEVIQRLVRGLCNQLYNAPLDMIIDSRVHEKYPFLHDSEFTWMADEHERNLAVLTDTAIRSIAPKKIYQANVTMNAAVVLFVDDLFNGATDLAAHYRATGLLSTGQRLYALWQEAMKNFQPGDEYLLVDAFARELKLTDTDDLSPGYASSTRPVGDEGGPTNPRLLNDPTLQMAATMYMVSAMKRFAQMSDAQVYQVVGEIALVGYTGLDYASNEPKYTLRFLPGESFSGLQMMCLMYVGFKRVQPGVDSGIPLDDAYEHALSLYEADKD